MDTIRNFFILATVLALTSISSVAQNQDALLQAFSRSYQAEMEGNYTKAAEALNKVFNKESYPINVRLGWLNYKAGLFEESTAFYQKAIQLMPYGIEARFGIVYPLSSNGQWEEVIRVYQKILDIDPQNSVANYRLGLVYYGRENYTECDKLFTKVVNLYPFDYDGLHMLAWTKLRSGKTQEAKSLFQTALLYRPGDQSCSDGLALIK